MSIFGENIGAKVLIGALIFGFVGLILILYWAFFPYDVIEIKNAPVPVRPTMVGKEEAVIITFQYCKKIDVEGVVRVALVSKSTKIPLPEYIDRTPKGCSDPRKPLEAPVLLPPQAASDRYHYEYEIIYKVNPLKEVKEEFKSQEFDLKKQPDIFDTPTN